MTKSLLILMAAVALASAALLAQAPSMGSAFQQPGWIAAPGSKPIDVHMNIPEGQSGPVLGKPFSGTEVRHTVQTLGDGTHVENTYTSVFCRDERGRMRAESPTRVLIYDPVSGFTYDLDPGTKSYYKRPISDKAATTWIAVVGNRTSISSHSNSLTEGDLAAWNARLTGRARSATLSVTEDLPPQVIHGVNAKGSRITMTIPAGTFGNDREIKIVNERWYSDDLKVLLKSSNSDPRFGVTTYELTNIVQAPPDPTLFQVPADYTLKVHKVHYHKVH